MFLCALRSLLMDAFTQRHAAEVAQLRVVAQHLRQPVKRNSTAKVMHVVNTNISREPPQQNRQFIM